MSTADVLPARLRAAVSPYTGIVRSLEECLHTTTEPPLFRFACDVCRGSGLLGSPLDHLSGIGGAGLTRREAAAACVGEALERYSATYVPRHRLVVASARELGDAAVAPERFALFSARQLAQEGFPFQPFTPDTKLPWVAGRSLADGAEAWLPAELVFLADTVGPGGSRIAYATSNGLACAPTVDDTLVRALCELLERDAFMIVWANRLSLPQLDWSGDERISALDARLFEPLGLEYAAVDLSAFHGLPSVLGVVRAPQGRAGALGEASRLCPNVAPGRLLTLLALARSPELQQTVARSSRTHDHRPGIDLEHGNVPVTGLATVLHERRSSPPAGPGTLTLDDLAVVLEASYVAPAAALGAARRPVPSAGALYPLELYVLGLRVAGIEAIAFHYNPFRHRLEILGAVDFDDVREALVDPTLVDRAAAILVVTAVFWRSRFKYGLRGYRFALLEAGHVVQNAVLAATALGLSALPLGGFYDRRLDALVGADRLDEASVYALVLGGPS